MLLPVAVYGAFRSVWIIPTFSACEHIRTPSWVRLIEILVVAAGSLAQLIFAVDTTRLLGYMFPVVVLSCWDILDRSYGRSVISLAVAGTVLLPRLYAISGTLRCFAGFPPSCSMMADLFGRMDIVGPGAGLLHALSPGTLVKVMLVALLLTAVVVAITQLANKQALPSALSLQVDKKRYE
jgi:hypothetical protein